MLILKLTFLGSKLRKENSILIHLSVSNTKENIIHTAMIALSGSIVSTESGI